MDEAAIATEYLPFAIKVARRLWHDSEADSVAGLALLLAVRSYDGRIPLKHWIARCVRIETYHYWRKIRVRAPWSEQVEDEVWEYVATYDEPISECTLSEESWQILCERYVTHWAEDVIARRRGITVYRVRKLIADAIEELEKCDPC